MKPQSCGGVQTPQRGFAENMTLCEQGEAALSGRGGGLEEQIQNQTSVKKMKKRLVWIEAYGG